jgi:pentapeptide MXKDX repeat protein
MNKLTATILASCLTFAIAGAFAADSPSDDPASRDNVSQQTMAKDATEHDTTSDGNAAKDAMSHDSMAKDGATSDEVKQ